MAMRDYKTSIRVDPRVSHGIKIASDYLQMPAYRLTETIMWDWLNANMPELAQQMRNWRPSVTKADLSQVKLPDGAIFIRPIGTEKD
jgi:hypothetical protein